MKTACCEGVQVASLAGRMRSSVPVKLVHSDSSLTLKYVSRARRQEP